MRTSRQGRKLRWCMPYLSFPGVRRITFVFFSIAAIIILVSTLITASPLFAGPPFRTDDPETVEYEHW